MENNIQENISEVTENYEHFVEDVEKFISKGNSSAAVRARKALLEIGKLTKVVRKQIQDMKNDK